MAPKTGVLTARRLAMPAPSATTNGLFLPIAPGMGQQIAWQLL